MKRGESATFDLNFDEKEDIKILLEEINQNRITLTITALQKEKKETVIEQVPEEPTKERVSNTAKEKITKSWLNKDLWSVFFLLMLMAASVANLLGYVPQAPKAQRKKL
ncbi:MAG TPA: hypothetical protein VJH37_03255 [Candidatus Nanoarchaeia archaeon]|nr:hypothetical protein [Candidatus Nanoarchaeia archaeon]